jgi:GT2 family glycosyltransferase
MIFVSVVSHGHFDLIKELGVLANIAKDSRFSIFLVDNVGEANLEAWCEKYNIFYTKNKKKLGFGANNNLNFARAEEISKSVDDYFIVLNPDLIVDPSTLVELQQQSKKSEAPISTVNLFLDRELTLSEDCIRNFPSAMSFLKSFLLGKNSTIIPKNNIIAPVSVDWCAGCLIGFSMSHYRQLNGFDERYFMYCEDIDICYRSCKIHGKRVMYFPNIKAVHLSQRRSRRFLSKHFYWHIVSAIRFIISRQFH